MCFWRAKRIPFEYSSEGEWLIIKWNGHKIFGCPINRIAFELEAINKYSFNAVGHKYGDTPVKFKYRVTTNGVLFDEYQEIIEGEWIHTMSKLRRFNSQQKHTL